MQKSHPKCPGVSAGSADHSASAQRNRGKRSALLFWYRIAETVPDFPHYALGDEDGHAAQSVLVLAHYDAAKSCLLANVSQFPWWWSRKVGLSFNQRYLPAGFEGFPPLLYVALIWFLTKRKKKKGCLKRCPGSAVASVHLIPEAECRHGCHWQFTVAACSRLSGEGLCHWPRSRTHLWRDVMVEHVQYRPCSERSPLLAGDKGAHCASRGLSSRGGCMLLTSLCSRGFHCSLNSAMVSAPQTSLLHVSLPPSLPLSLLGLSFVSPALCA